jgi:glycosyltransferase involved in cell wall biosynthesis
MTLKVSIITVCLNSSKTIISTLQSISDQAYSNIEHIIVDGGSTDGTLDLVKTWRSHEIKLINRPNLGIYQSMNTGINLSTGDIVGILNADDFFSDNTVITDITNIFQNKNPDAIFGDIVYVHQSNLNLIIRNWSSGPYRKDAFKMGWQPPHPTFYLRRDLYMKYGLYDAAFKTAADFELMLRFFEIHEISSEYLPRVLVKMRIGGVSNKSYRNILIANYANLLAFNKNNLKVNYFLYPLFRLLPKFINLIYNKILNK